MRNKLCKKREFLLLISIILFSIISVNTLAGNVSVNYGWNGSDYIPFKLTGDGKVMTDIDAVNLTAGSFTATGNISLGEKITFALGEVIDNLVDGLIKITGSLNITENLNVIGNITGGSPVKIKGSLKVINDSGDSQFSVNSTTGIIESTEIDRLETNYMLNTFRIAEASSLSVQYVMDGIVDWFVDATGIDATLSINESRDSGSNFYARLGSSSGTFFTTNETTAYNWSAGTLGNLTVQGNINLTLSPNGSGDYENTTGTYESKVFDVGSLASWDNISWNSFPYQEELPNDLGVEINYSDGNTNMTGNVLLLHFNNNSAFGENDTNVYDFSGSNNNGTSYVNNSDGSFRGPNATGKFGKAYEFDGVDDYIDVTYDASLDLSSFTLAAWFKTTKGQQAVIDKIKDSNPWNGYGMGAGLGTLNKLDCSANGQIGWRSSARIINDNEWHHGVCAYNGTHMKVYLDGALESDSAQTASASYAVNLYIGRRRGSATKYFSGAIDEVAIWSRSLSASEIANLYKRGVLRLNIQTRTSNDNSTWTSWSSNHTNPSGTINESVRYLQYLATLTTNHVGYSPSLEWVNISYTRASTENFILISQNFTAVTEPRKSKLVFIMEEIDTATLNTDIKAYVSLDDGTNYEQVTLSNNGNYNSDGSKKIITGAETLTDRNEQTMRWKIATYNDKNIRIHGVAQNWK